MPGRPLRRVSSVLRRWLWLALPVALAIDLGGADTTKAEITDFAIGGDHSCLLTTGSGLQCWGRNLYGQLGDGTHTNSSVPVAVLGLGSSSAVALGGENTCVLTMAGGVQCWGYNGYGQLGDGTNADSNLPMDVVGLSNGVSDVSMADGHHCALTTGGGVKCWGLNSSGELGNGTNTSSNVPVEVVGLSSGVSAIDAGNYHTCALTTSGGVKCWGDNYYGALGTGNTTSSNVPMEVVGLSSGVSAISAGHHHTCALTTGGAVKCWGDAAFGKLGNGTDIQSEVPVEVVGLSSGVSAISAGNYHNCALTTSGAVKCWGRNTHGELGNASNTSSNVPVDVSGLSSGVSAIYTANGRACALTTGVGIKCWGDNEQGQFGNGTSTSSNVPVDVVGFLPLWTIWQIGSFDASKDEFFVGPADSGFKCDSLPSDSPGSQGPFVVGTTPFSDFPGEISSSDYPTDDFRSRRSCRSVTVQFAVADGFTYVVLEYSRMGGELDQIFLDDQSIGFASLLSGDPWGDPMKARLFLLEVPNLSPGVHAIRIEGQARPACTVGYDCIDGKANGFHWVDALRLKGQQVRE